MANSTYRVNIPKNAEELLESVKASRDLLLGVYRDTPKTLGEYGFEVDDSARAARKQP